MEVSSLHVPLYFIQRTLANFLSALRPKEVSDRLQLEKIAKDHTWKVEPSCATTGEGIFEGLVRAMRSVPVPALASHAFNLPLNQHDTLTNLLFLIRHGCPTTSNFRMLPNKFSHFAFNCSLYDYTRLPSPVLPSSL